MALGVIESVKAKGLTKRFGHHRALANVGLDLTRGQVCALLGPNGAGKSTLLGILSTLVRPTSGKVSFRSGKSEIEAGPELRKQIGVLAHESFVYGQLNAYENLRFFGKLYELDNLDARIESLLDDVGLEKPARLRAAQTYSRGMLQRLAVARALLSEPSVLLFDEPFTGLDRGGAETLSKTLVDAKKADRIIVVVTHDLDPLGDIADRVMVLRRGAVAFEEQRDAPYTAKELKAIYGEHSA